MRRLTRGIGLFGGPGATMSAKKIKLPSPKTEARPAGDVAPTEPRPPAERSPDRRKGWLQRLFGPGDDPKE